MVLQHDQGCASGSIREVPVNPFHLFEMIVEFGAAVMGGLMVVVAFTLFCVAVVTEIRDFICKA